jgi:hypothetical protein
MVWCLVKYRENFTFTFTFTLFIQLLSNHTGSLHFSGHVDFTRLSLIFLPHSNITFHIHIRAKRLVKLLFRYTYLPKFKLTVMYYCMPCNNRVVCKIRGLTLLLRVETLWRCGDDLFVQSPPLASDALLTTLHPLLESVLQTVDHFEISCLGAPFSWSEKPRNRMGRDLN